MHTYTRIYIYIYMAIYVYIYIHVWHTDETSYGGHAANSFFHWQVQRLPASGVTMPAQRFLKFLHSSMGFVNGGGAGSLWTQPGQDWGEPAGDLPVDSYHTTFLRVPNLMVIES